MAKLSRHMLHSVWAPPLSLLTGLFVGRSCEALSVYVTRRRSDMMLGPVEGTHTINKCDRVHLHAVEKASCMHQLAHAEM